MINKSGTYDKSELTPLKLTLIDFNVARTLVSSKVDSAGTAKILLKTNTGN